MRKVHKRDRERKRDKERKRNEEWRRDAMRWFKEKRV